MNTANNINFISPNVRTFGEMIESRTDRNYLIPGYQRPYEWDKEQIERVFSSIESNIDSIDSSYPLLLGTIQLNKSGNNYEIIDGQQRLTTLWLLHCVLRNDEDKKKYSFSPKNEVNAAYAVELRNAAETAETANPANKYSENIEYIRKLVNTYLEKANDKAKAFESLSRYILDKIIFVEIVTDFGNSENGRSIERTIQIFDSLNTAGLPLDIKDIFKIKFRDYLAKITGADDGLFSKINDAYNTVLECEVHGVNYAISEEDLLDAYRFYLIGNDRNSASTGFRQSNSAFFEELFNKDKNLPIVSIDNLMGLAKVMCKTQELMQVRDKRSGSILQNCAKELFSYSGYGRLKNLFFTLVYAQVGNNADALNESHIQLSLRVMELLWKACSVMHSTIGKVVNCMYNCIGEALRSFIKNPNESALPEIKNKLQDPINQWRNRTKVFSGLFGADYNLFGNTRSYLFVALSYIQDCGQEETAYSVKEALFYRSDPKTRVEIAHIASHKLYDDQNFVNSIGNLMFLERDINRRLGRNTAGKQKNK